MVAHFQKPRKKFENKMHSATFLTNFKVSGNVVKHSLSLVSVWYIFSIKTKTKKKKINEFEKWKYKMADWSTCKTHKQTSSDSDMKA